MFDWIHSPRSTITAGAMLRVGVQAGQLANRVAGQLGELAQLGDDSVGLRRLGPRAGACSRTPIRSASSQSTDTTRPA